MIGKNHEPFSVLRAALRGAGKRESGQSLSDPVTVSEERGGEYAIVLIGMRRRRLRNDPRARKPAENVVGTSEEGIANEAARAALCARLFWRPLLSEAGFFYLVNDASAAAHGLTTAFPADYTSKT